MPHRKKLEAGLRCRCGLEYPPSEFVNGLCPECQLARILTKYDRPAPDRIQMSFFRPKNTGGNHETQ
ncbi:hypothetical protein [Desulfosarcina variabilis]|uniref:hypothetical protein n=1 Tax=Desulfosarcina variabilis TaxID=2300 RepID=UPI003AFB48D5